MNNDDTYAAQTQQKFEEWFWIGSRYSTDKPGFWAKMDGLEELHEGCKIETAAKEVKPEVSEFSFESKEPHQISWSGEWPEESRYISDDDDDDDSQERRLLSTFGGNPFGFEAKSEFKVDGEMSMDFIFSPNPNILIKIVPPFMDIKAEMQFSLQKEIEHDINFNQYELTEKKTLYSDFFLVGAVPITVKVLAQPVADIHIRGTSEVSGLVSMKLDGQVRISDDFVQLRLDLLEGEIDYNTIEPSLQLTGFNDIWSFDYHAMANLDIDVKVGIQLEVVVADAISFELKPSVQASTTLSSGQLEVVVADAISFEFKPSVQASTTVSSGTPNSPMINGEASSCPLVFSASAQLGTSMDIGAGLKRQDGNDFNLITLMEDNCKTFEDQLTDGWFDWIDDWHSSLMDFSSDYYYDQEGSYSTVCSAVFDVLDMSIAWDGSINALKDLHLDLNMYDAELFRFDSPQVCMGPEGFEVNSRGHFSHSLPTPRPGTTKPTPSPTPRPTPSPTPSPSRPTSTPRPTPRPTPSPSRPASTPRPTPRPTPSPTDDNVFCTTNSDCASDEYCDHALIFTCQKKRAAWFPCVPGRGDCRDGLTCTPLFLCVPNWWG